MLLNVFYGAKYYKDIIIIDGIVHQRLKEVHLACRLFVDDNEWNEALPKVSTGQLQDNFVICSD